MSGDGETHDDPIVPDEEDDSDTDDDSDDDKDDDAMTPELEPGELPVTIGGP